MFSTVATFNQRQYLQSLEISRQISCVLRGIKWAISRKLVKISVCRVSSFLKTVAGFRVSGHAEFANVLAKKLKVWLNNKLHKSLHCTIVIKFYRTFLTELVFTFFVFKYQNHFEFPKGGKRSPRLKIPEIVSANSNVNKQTHIFHFINSRRGRPSSQARISSRLFARETFRLYSIWPRNEVTAYRKPKLLTKPKN